MSFIGCGASCSCLGCHEDRMSAPPWGAGPFAYEKVVQPVWDAQCVRCHDAKDKDRINLTGTLDREGVTASYRTNIERGWAHHFDCDNAQRHQKAEPLSFGTVKSRLWQMLEAGQYKVDLTREEVQRVKTWIDLNCLLWPNYLLRDQRRRAAQVSQTR
jgi:hypothetical protein